ncbi:MULTISPECIES: glucosyltransferase domain-containing protein [Helcococcus]|uniref:Glucosyltransferase domain-containing protein n=1 Tax=Helcococcus bovis TaxID=3153252 RepID=A0ABW9F807_9FIRM
MPSKIFEELNKKIPKNVKKAFLYTILFGVICHFYALTNKLINHDDIDQLVHNMDFSTSGRWFLHYAAFISSNFSMPWVNGGLIIFYTAISSALLADLFEIKKEFHIILLSAIMICFPTNAALFPYMNSADAYALGELFIILGAYLMIKYQYGFVGSIILTVLSLAIYQTYLGLAASIVIIYYIFEIINKKNNFNFVLKKLFIALFSYISSLTLYVISVKYIFSIQLSEYQGIDKMGVLNLKDLPISILSTFYEFFRFFFLDSYDQFGFYTIVNTIIFVGMTFLFINLIRKLEIKKLIFVCLLILILPISVNSIFILAPNSAIGLRMLQGYIAVYILFIMIFENYSKLKIKEKMNLTTISLCASAIAFLLTIGNFLIVTNKVYMTLDVDGKNLASYTTRVLSRIEEQPFYDKNKPVYFIGNPNITNEFTSKYTTKDVLKSTLLDEKITMHYFWYLYPERYSGFTNPVKEIWNKDLVKIEDENLKNTIYDMPIYPKKGSIIEYKGSIYIKFKEYTKQ